MKKAVAMFSVIAATQGCFAADSAGLAGIMNTSDTVDVNDMPNPRSIWTVYIPNDPSEQAVVLAYVAAKRLGTHQLSVEWNDKNGKYIDKCSFKPFTVSNFPYIHTVTCKWGGRLSDGGLTFSVYNTFEGKKEKIGEMFLPSKH